MLHNHPKIAIPYESHFITDYYEKIDQLEKSKNAFLKAFQKGEKNKGSYLI